MKPAKRIAIASRLVFGVVAGVVVASSSCRPDLGGRESLITQTQVLAVRGDPPEEKAGEAVHYSLLVATPRGPVATPLASWAFCATPKLLTENGAASAGCLSTAVRPIAELSSAVDVALPIDTCALFGPEITSAELRPRDPDITGGYYQPLRVTVFGLDGPGETTVAYGLQRIRCKLANAAAEVTTDFARRYVANKNPELDPLAITTNDDARAPIARDAIPRGATVRLRASWPETESYVVYDLVTRSVVERRETMRVSWSTTAGTFENDRTGRSDSELETFTENAWTAPSEARTSHIFIVLRDARGGVAFATYELVTR